MDKLDSTRNGYHNSGNLTGRPTKATLQGRLVDPSSKAVFALDPIDLFIFGERLPRIEEVEEERSPLQSRVLRSEPSFMTFHEMSERQAISLPGTPEIKRNPFPVASPLSASPHLNEVDAIISSFELTEEQAGPLLSLVSGIIQDLEEGRQFTIKAVRKSEDRHGFEIAVFGSEVDVRHLVREHRSRNHQALPLNVHVGNLSDQIMKVYFELNA